LIEGTRLAQRYRLLFSVYLSFVALVTFCYGILNVYVKSNWVMGDWLINYRGGFVRRGLPGEVALRAGRLLHVSPMYIVLLMQLLAYGAAFYSVWRLLARTNWSAWVLVMLVSPATLAFQVLDPIAGFRKEEILIGGLGLLLVALVERPPAGAWLVLYLAVLGVFSALSHESLILFAPYLFAAVAIGLGSVSGALRICALPLALMGACGFFVKGHIGDIATAKQICASLGYAVTDPLPPMCRGAIAYLANDQSVARRETAGYIHTFHYFALYPLVTLLAVAPFAMAWVALWRYVSLRRSLLVLAVAALASATASVVLFVYAEDWGRWIYIHLFCIFLLLLFIDYRRQVVPDIPPALPPGRALRLAVILAVAVYATCWDLPHVPIYPARFGYFGLARYIYEYPTLHRPTGT